jgi:hypothetical protein
MTILAAVLIALGSLVAVGNIGGCIGAYLRSRRGEGGGFSSVPFLSLLFCVLAWVLSRDQFTPWVFLPAILDPANWSLIALPVFLLLHSGDQSGSTEHDRLAAPGALPAEQRNSIVEEIGWRLGALASYAAQERYMVNATKDEYLLPVEALNHARDVVDALEDSSPLSALRGMDPRTRAAVRRFARVWPADAQQIDALLELSWDELVLRDQTWNALRAAAQMCLSEIGFDHARWEEAKGYAALQEDAALEARDDD